MRHTRGLELGHNEGRLIVDRQHEHRETLERHRLITGEPRKICPEREQKSIEARLPHAVPHTGKARRPRQDGVRARFSWTA